jgi:hypothetical protein
VTERVLSTRELNRALLARQLLLERSPLPLVAALEQVAGLQTQYAPSAYIGLWSRLRDFRRDQLTTALEDRRAVQATLLRVTIHIVSAGDYPPLTEAIRSTRREWWTRATRRELEGVDMAAAATLVRERLVTGPARQPELTKLLVDRGFPTSVWTGVGLWVDLVRVRLPVPGSGGGPICTAWPTTGWGHGRSRRRTGWSISSAATSPASVRRPSATWAAGRASR